MKCLHSEALVFMSSYHLCRLTSLLQHPKELARQITLIDHGVEELQLATVFGIVIDKLVLL